MGRLRPFSSRKEKIMTNQPSFIWATPKLSKNFESIDCPEHDSHKDFIRDPSGFYVLIKINFDQLRIEVAICDKSHAIIKIFSGRKAQDIYHTICRYEKQHRVVWFKEKTHLAYLGKELKKAELAMVLGNGAYFQE